MFSLLSKITLILVFVFSIFNMIESSTGSSLENDKLAQLIERLDRMQTKMDVIRSSVEVENAQLIERLNRMQVEMDVLQNFENLPTKMESLETEKAETTERYNRMQSRIQAENAEFREQFYAMKSRMEAEADKTNTKLDKLEAENFLQAEEIFFLKSQIATLQSLIIIPKLPSDKNDGPWGRSLTGPPSSCQELKDKSNGLMPIDGIHLLNNKNTNKIEAAFCSFPSSYWDSDQTVSQKIVGNVDVKTKTVHFYVQRNSSFKAERAVIPFQVERLNEGEGMDLKSGVFTAPVPGIYHFEFSGSKDKSTIMLDIYLQLNGENIGHTCAYEPAMKNEETASLSASLRLKAGDRVRLFIDYNSILFDDQYHRTHFTGWLVEEDLSID